MRAHAWAWGAQAWGLAERADHLAWGVVGCEGVAAGSRRRRRQGGRIPARSPESGQRGGGRWGYFFHPNSPILTVETRSRCGGCSVGPRGGGLGPPKATLPSSLGLMTLIKPAGAARDVVRARWSSWGEAVARLAHSGGALVPRPGADDPLHAYGCACAPVGRVGAKPSMLRSPTRGGPWSPGLVLMTPFTPTGVLARPLAVLGRSRRCPVRPLGGGFGPPAWC